MTAVKVYTVWDFCSSTSLFLVPAGGAEHVLFEVCAVDAARALPGAAETRVLR